MQGQYRLGVDAGGTFTDFVLAGRDGKIRLFKSASTPQDGTRAIAAGLAQMAEELGRPVEDIVRDCDLCINGTTVALNALIELKGVKVGLCAPLATRTASRSAWATRKRATATTPTTRRRRSWCRAGCACRCASACWPTARCASR